MPARAARGDIDAAEVAEVVLRYAHVIEENVAGIERHAPQRGIADGTRLLVNFLEHEMLEAALFRHDRVPHHPLRFTLHRIAVEVRDFHPRWSDHREVAI